jgi:hypothetical protein
MTNPDIANQNRRRAASWPVFKPGITMEDSRRLLVRLNAMKHSVIGNIHDIRDAALLAETGGTHRQVEAVGCPEGAIRHRHAGEPHGLFV